jgi:DNA-binding NarL/FixJ family response regulator
MKILLVDSNALFRSGIARLLDSQPDFEVVGETGDHMDAVHLVTQFHPDIVLLETDLDGCEGATLAALIHQQFPAIQLVFLTFDPHPQRILDGVLAGASGYLLKTITPDDLFARLRGLQKHEAAIALTTVWQFMNLLSSSRYMRYLRAAPSHNLTRRESQILSGVARGLTNKEIGSSLQISEHTVRNHLCSIYEKLNLENRLQVAVYSVVHGLVDIDHIQ